MSSIVDLFPVGGVRADTKLLSLGRPASDLADRVRSLNLEHVSPAELMRSEISRRSRLPVTAETVLASMRRWFFARKPDAGFVLTDFPATLLQAKVFDEWLEARGESLSGVLAGTEAPWPVREHYRTLGLLLAGPGPILA